MSSSQAPDGDCEPGTTFLPRRWKPSSRIIFWSSSSSVRRASSVVIQRARLSSPASEHASIGCPLRTSGRGARRCPGVGVSLDSVASWVVGGYSDAEWTADDRRLLLTTGMREHTCSGVIGRPSPGSAEKAVLAALVGSSAPVLDVLQRTD